MLLLPAFMPSACYCTKPNQPSRVYFAPAVSKPRTQHKTPSKAVPGGDTNGVISHSEDMSMPLLERTVLATKPPQSSGFHPPSHHPRPLCSLGSMVNPQGATVELQSPRGFGDSRHRRPPPSLPRAGWRLSCSGASPSPCTHQTGTSTSSPSQPFWPKIKLPSIAHAITDQSMLLIKL